MTGTFYAVKNIVLVGFMGVGKTSIGRKLAKRLGMRFIDTDEVIEWESGKSVAEIFEEDGEDYFRRKEEEVLRNLVSQDSLVIATGGGAFENTEIRKLCKDKCATVYLESSLQNIMKRVDRLRLSRPLLKDKNFDKIRGLYDSRIRFYSECEFCIKVDNAAEEEIIENILRLFEHTRI